MQRFTYKQPKPYDGSGTPDIVPIETAAKMLGVYAALNPGRATVVALPAPAKRDDTTS